MSEKDKTILIVILAAVALCGCFVISCCAASFYMISHSDKNTIQSLIFDNESVSSNENIQDSKQVNNDDRSASAADSSGLSVEEKLIIDETEKKRNLKASEILVPIYQTEDDLREYMINELDDVSDEELDEELRLYNILGFAPKGFDLRKFYVDLYSEQIAGFYDPEENQMYLVKDISPYENALTLAHEYTHYLQYNNPDFDETLHYDEDFCEDHGETCMIIDALVEGDATLTESLIDADTILKNYQEEYSPSEPSESIFDSAPKFFQDSLLFPYVYGFDFTAYHYMKGGFDAVNDLFINLPQSVEQIMHPEKYLKDAPINVTLEPFKSMITDKFDIIREDVLNEADVKMILFDGYKDDWQLSEQQSNIASEGWGGGSFIFAENEGKDLFFSKIVWDSEKDAEEAETALGLYCDRRFGALDQKNSWKGDDSSSVHLVRQGDILYWMILPDTFESDHFIDLLKNGSAL